jgi:hypothetical protein
MTIGDSKLQFLGKSAVVQPSSLITGDTGTLQNAVDACGDGGTVMLAGGSYGDATITGKTVVFRGMGARVDMGTITSDSPIELRDVVSNTPVVCVTPRLIAYNSDVEWTPTSASHHGELYGCQWVFDDGAAVLPAATEDMVVDAGTISRSGLGIVADSPSSDQENYVIGGATAGAAIRMAAAHTWIIYSTGPIRIGGFKQTVLMLGFPLIHTIVNGGNHTITIGFDGSGSDLENRVVRPDLYRDIYVPPRSSVRLFGVGAASSWLALEMQELSEDKFVDHVEEFDGGTYASATAVDWGLLKGDADGAGGSSFAKASLNDDKEVGVVTLEIGTGASTYAAIYGGGDFDKDTSIELSVDNAVLQIWRFKIDTLSDGTNTYRVLAGMGDGWTAGFPTRGMGVQYNAPTSTKWRTFTVDSGAPSVHDSAAVNATVATGWHEVAAFVPYGSAKAYFLVDGLLAGIETAALPTGKIFPLFRLEFVAGGATRRVHVSRERHLFEWPDGR